MPNYKTGKVTEAISFDFFQEKVKKANLLTESEAFMWLLYYCGVRKSEAFERVAEDVKMENGCFVIDFHQRKKRGAHAPPQKIPQSWPGIPSLIAVYEKAKKRRAQHKCIFVYELHEGAKTRIWKRDGKPRAIKERTSKDVLAHWLFPNIGSTQAWRIVKRVLGSKYYPHFLRLNRITEICKDPTTNFSRLKSFTGIKSFGALEYYMGTSSTEVEEAFDFMAKQINKKRS